MALDDRDVRRLVRDTGGAELFGGGRYEVAGEAFTIGDSRVFVAIDRDTGDKVAIKLLLGGQDTARIIAAAGSALDHAAIVRVLDAGASVDGAPYLVTEWLAGETLAARLTRSPPSALDVAALGARAANGLAYLHARGAVHGNVRASNVFLVHRRADRAKLIDVAIEACDRGDDVVALGRVLGAAGGDPPPRLVHAIASLVAGALSADAAAAELAAIEAALRAGDRDALERVPRRWRWPWG